MVKFFGVKDFDPIALVGVCVNQRRPEASTIIALDKCSRAAVMEVTRDPGPAMVPILPGAWPIVDDEWLSEPR